MYILLYSFVSHCLCKQCTVDVFIHNKVQDYNYKLQYSHLWRKYLVINLDIHVLNQGKDLECVKVLLVFGADVNSFNAQQETPIDIANQLNSMVRCSILCMNKFDFVYIKLMRQCHLCLYASLHYKQRGWSNLIDLLIVILF